MSLNPAWTHDLKIRPDDMVNSVAISDDASRIAAGTWYHNYSRMPGPSPFGSYAVYLLDKDGNELWHDRIDNCYQGFYSVAVSGMGNVVAAGGWLDDPPGPERIGLVRAYDAIDGTRLFPEDPPFPDRVNSVALSADGKVLAAGADQLYIFLAEADGTFAASPLIASPPTNPVNSVAVDPSGTWVVSCDQAGNVCLSTIASGGIQTFAFSDPSVHFHSVAIARSSEFFAAGGSHFVYLFSKTSMTQSPPVPVAPRQQTSGSVRWVAISDSGAFITAVSNNQATGVLTAFGREMGSLIKAWEKPLNFKPNGTGVDATGKFVAAADGFDADQPGGTFYLFDSFGTKIGDLGTAKMNWPIAVSADGTGVAAGSDDGNVYFFVPQDQ
jgi:WD40 repeat protein